jgi:hypothetical protein
MLFMIYLCRMIFGLCMHLRYKSIAELQTVDSKDCRLILERDMNHHLLSRLMHGRKIYSLHTMNSSQETLSLVTKICECLLRGPG